MSLIDRIQRALVIAPHPDDEILGVGGTTARLAAMGRDVQVAIVTTGVPPRFAANDVARVAAETVAAHLQVGISHTQQLGLPAAALDTVPHADLNQAIGAVVASVQPDTLFVPFLGDVHLDHQLVFNSAMVTARPCAGAYPARVLAYETLSETNWYAPGLTPIFAPNVYVDIAAHLETKLAAFASFASQVREFPSERSPDALRALAMLRGATVNRAAAEALC